MKRFTLNVSAALTTAVLVVAGSAGTADAAKSAEANSVTRWVERSLDAVRVQNVGTPNAGRLYAMVTVAMYDAVNGIDRARRRGRTHALVPPAGAPVSGQRDVAAAAAAHAVLTALLRADQPPVVDGALDLALTSEIHAAGGEGGRRVTAGRDWGTHVGRRVVALRAADGTATAQTIAACSRFTNPVICDPGEFHASFDARFRSMAPFGVASAFPYLSTSPPALGSAEYAAAFEDVRTCGSNSPVLDALCVDPTTAAERAEISSFWLAEAGTVRETGTWLQAAVAIAQQRRTVASTSDTSRLFALVGMAIADAVKASWEAKATFFTWRPTTAIRRADSDGNPETVQSDTWTARITPAGGPPTVGGSPEYNSGTSTFSGAASAAIEGFYCHEPVAFSFETDLASNGPRFYASPLEAAREAGRSRIFQGIHFQFSNEDGRRAGRGIGHEIVSTKLQPVASRSRADACP